MTLQEALENVALATKPTDNIKKLKELVDTNIRKWQKVNIVALNTDRLMSFTRSVGFANDDGKWMCDDEIASVFKEAGTDWETKRGKFPKRFRNAARKMGYKITDDEFGLYGTKVQPLFEERFDGYARFILAEDVNWNKYQFGQSNDGSCWWGSKKDSWGWFLGEGNTQEGAYCIQLADLEQVQDVWEYVAEKADDNHMVVKKANKVVFEGTADDAHAFMYRVSQVEGGSMHPSRMMANLLSERRLFKGIGRAFMLFAEHDGMLTANLFNAYLNGASGNDKLWLYSSIVKSFCPKGGSDIQVSDQDGTCCSETWLNHDTYFSMHNINTEPYDDFDMCGNDYDSKFPSKLVWSGSEREHKRWYVKHTPYGELKASK
jgi:hypothetical protein